MDVKFELVPIPVTDVDRAKAFYADQVGFSADVDVRPADGVRVMQLSRRGRAARSAWAPDWRPTRRRPARYAACTWSSTASSRRTPS